jgi:hypothetical protein
MEGNRGSAPVWMTILLVGAALAYLFEAVFSQEGFNLSGLQNRRPRHLSDPDCLHPNELRFQRWLSILEQHAKDFL